MKSINFIMKRPNFYSLHSFSVLFIFFLYLFLVLCNNTTEALIKLPENVVVPAIYGFGDSIIDTGNNNGLPTVIKSNFPPYGKDINFGIPTGRFCNGRTPLDIIAEDLGIKYLVPAYLDPLLKPQDLLTGVCFASSASGYDPLTSQLLSVLPLSQQLELFKKYIKQLKIIVGEEKANYILKNSFYLLVSGTDDLANTYFTLGTRHTEFNINSYADLMVTYASTFIKELYELGARRIGVFNIPPLGCLPGQRTLKGGPLRLCVEYENVAARLVNSKLSFAIQALGLVLPQSRIVDIDIYTPFLDLIQHPRIHGFEVADRGCCGAGTVEVSLSCNPTTPTCLDRSKYIFWDSYHPTDKGYETLVQGLILKYIFKFL